MSRRLVLNLDIRYDLFTHPYEANNNQSNNDIATNTLIVYLRDTDHAPTPCGTSNERVLVAIHRAPTTASATITADTFHLQLPGDEALIAACR